MLWKNTHQSNKIDNPFYEQLDIPNSVYNDVKNLAKRKFRERKLILVESVADWESAYQIIAEDLEHVKVGYLYKYPQNDRDVVCLHSTDSTKSICQVFPQPLCLTVLPKACI